MIKYRFVWYYLLQDVCGVYRGPATTAYPYYGTTEVDWTNWGVTSGTNDFADYGRDWWNKGFTGDDNHGRKANLATTQFAEIFASTQATNWHLPQEKVTTFDMFGTTSAPEQFQVRNFNYCHSH